MTYISKILDAHKFTHHNGCNFESELKSCSIMKMSFGYESIEAYDADDFERITIKYCPYCGIYMDITNIRSIEIQKRFDELSQKNGIKIGDEVSVNKFKSLSKTKISNIRYDENLDRILYENYRNNGYMMGGFTIEEIQIIK